MPPPPFAGTGFLSFVAGPIEFITKHFALKQVATMAFFSAGRSRFSLFEQFHAPSLAIRLRIRFLIVFFSKSRFLSRGLQSHEGACEQKYRALHDDIAAHRQLWMDYFDLRDNYRHAENVCGILVRVPFRNSNTTQQIVFASQLILTF
jgi:hypothetical protein